MALDEYRKKRDFRRTPEPDGRTRGASRQRTFVVQKHAAKGPSMSPADKRPAIRTESIHWNMQASKASFRQASTARVW